MGLANVSGVNEASHELHPRTNGMHKSARDGIGVWFVMYLFGRTWSYWAVEEEE